MSNKKLGLWAGMGAVIVGLVAAWAWTPKPALPFEPFEPSLSLLERAQRDVLTDTVEQYAEIRGRFVHLTEIEREGYLFFALKNVATGAPLTESCDTPVAGAVCISLADPYTLNGIWGYGNDGSVQPLLYNLSRWKPARVIPAEERDQTRSYGLYITAKRLGYTDEELKLVMLGVILAYRVNFWGGRTAQEALAPFSREPLNKILDPATGEWLNFSGYGYGDRVRFEPGPEGQRLVTVKVLLNGKTLYASEVAPVVPRKTRWGYYISGGVEFRVQPPLGNPSAVTDDDLP